MFVARFLLANEKSCFKYEKKNNNNGRKATDSVLASDCLYLFINFRLNSSL